MNTNINQLSINSVSYIIKHNIKCIEEFRSLKKKKEREREEASFMEEIDFS